MTDLDTICKALEAYFESMDRTIEVGDISQTDIICMARNIIAALESIKVKS